MILDGFELGVTDSNLNSLRWGFDGRVHGANGGAGGRVFSPLQPDLNQLNLGDSIFHSTLTLGTGTAQRIPAVGLAWF